MVVTKAKVHDLPGIFGLLRDNGLTFSGVVRDLSSFLVIREGPKIIGCACLEIHGKVSLLRAVSDKKERQGQGLGMTLIFRMLDFARDRSVKKIYLLTESADKFFSKFGFERIKRSEVDPIIRQTEGFTHCCPCSSIVMVNHLTTRGKK